MKLLFLDLETGGLDPRRNPILSIGAAVYDLAADEVASTFYVECAVPKGSAVITDEALAVNGFQREAVEYESELPPGKRMESDAFRKLRQFAEVHGVTVLAGQNVGSFDLQFLLQRFPYSRNVYSYRTVDIHAVAVAVTGQSMSGDRLSTYLGIPAEAKPHNALRGALHAVTLWRLLQERICLGEQ